MTGREREANLPSTRSADGRPTGAANDSPAASDRPTPEDEQVASEASGERRMERVLALVSALLVFAPLALSGATPVGILLAWATLLLVYVALLRLFGLRSVLEVALFVFLLSACVASVLWLARHARHAEERP